MPLHMDWVLYFLLQHQNKWCPVALASRALNETELRYAQIEKEAFAQTLNKVRLTNMN